MEIYVQKNGERIGPISEEMIRQGISTGRFNADDPAWREGLESWTPISSIIGLSAGPNDVTDQPVSDAKPSNLEYDPASAFGMEDGGDLGIHKTISVFKSLDYGLLLPFRKILSLQLLRKKAVRWVLFFGLSPIAIFVFALNLGLSFKETIWLYEIYFCIFWALYFQSLIKPSKGIWRRSIGYAIFTAIAGIVCVLVIQILPLFRNLYDGTNGDSIFPRLIGFIFGVGVLEETVKALPLIMFGMKKGKSFSPRDGMFLGFISGIAFAAAEGVAYSFDAAQSAWTANSDLADAAFTLQVLQIMFRMMSGTLLHGAWSGSVGWFVGMASANNQHRWPIICVGIGFMAVIHGLNDLVAGSMFHLIVAAVTILIFMSYIILSDEQRQESAVDGNGALSNP